MYVIDEHYDESFYSSSLFQYYYGDARIGVFDIETTGLDRQKTKIILGGILTPTTGGIRLRQFFSERLEDEPDLLTEYQAALDDIDVLISYNGNHFDIPFVNGRLSAHRRPPAFSETLSFDLYQVIRNHSQLRAHLPNLKQKTVESFMGLWNDRKDQISGADSVYLYYEYLATRSPELQAFILLHNRDDLLQLARLLAVLEKLDLHRVAAHIGFPVVTGSAVAFVDSITLSKSGLECAGRYKNLPYEFIVFHEAYEILFSHDTYRFHLKIPCAFQHGATFADLLTLCPDAASLRKLPECQSDYLLLKEGKHVHYRSINYLVKHILSDAMQRFGNL